jgi:hypothetical protein
LLANLQAYQRALKDGHAREHRTTDMRGQDSSAQTDLVTPRWGKRSLARLLTPLPSMVARVVSSPKHVRA